MGSKYQPKRKSTAPQTPSDPDVEWENHLLLRVPTEFADRVRRFCTEATPEEQLHINFHPELRKGILQIGRDVLHFTIYDLPCIIEVMKTLDNVNVYKVADLAQILICSKTPVDEPNFTEFNSPDPTKNESIVKQKKEKFYQYPHGVAPSLKNVRKRRFRKTKKKKYMDAPEIEKEVKRLLRSDLEAESVRWEVVNVEQEIRPQGSQKNPSVGTSDKPSDTKEPSDNAPSTSATQQGTTTSDKPPQFDDEDSQLPPEQVVPDDEDLEDTDDDDEALQNAMKRTTIEPQDEDTMDAPPQPIDDIIGELSTSSDENEEEEE
ncbi:unnamed protein product [Bursaphelenchus xylophilus]|uniref:(pine wood nematode) hypothetical protein n=1 Tax=Bursaphelenchus xylophilus TaxID=6326 RepID=A0A1I7S9U8_BURXY|nr:unnamed protein product [Bursaphelenchus xylophilus]CAG9129253.1 unnamed protein product [Bursaphelenchus xylophilus]